MALGPPKRLFIGVVTVIAPATTEAFDLQQPRLALNNSRI
jgi:hypothetical protein